MDVLKVKNIEILNALQNHQEGEVAFCEDEQQYMTYKDNQWVPASSLQLNFYDLNKQIVSQLPPFDEVRINDAKDTLTAWANSSVYMLYGREISYFTVFQKQDDGEFETLADALFECLKSRGMIQSIEKTTEDNDAWEIWINEEINPVTHESKSFAYYLFNYDFGVIEC